MKKEFKVEVPYGYEIDKENSTFEFIKFKPIENKLPKTWEEYCEMHEVQIGESWINGYSEVCSSIETNFRDYESSKNLLPNVIYSKAMLALCQLIQLRDYYNNGWVPNWTNNDDKYVICTRRGNMTITVMWYTQHILSFKSIELCNEFLNNFRHLIEIAKPLL